MSTLCFPMISYPENQNFSNHLQVLQYKNLIIFTIKKYQKDMKNMRSSGYPNEKTEKEEYGAGRHFKLDIRDRFLMLLVYYRLYITYTLAGFLFDLDQSNVCRDIQKRLKD